MPAPIRPPPTIAIDRGRIMSLSRGISAVRVDDVSGMKIRRARTQEQQGTSQIFGFSQATDGNSREKTGAHAFRLFGVFEHPRSERRAEYGRCDGVNGDAVLAPFAAQGLGHAVNGGFGGTVG